MCIAGLCRELGSLFYCGAATQLGSALGALVAFLLVNEVRYPNYPVLILCFQPTLESCVVDPDPNFHLISDPAPDPESDPT